MPEHGKEQVRAALDAMIAYAGWLEGSSAVMADCAKLLDSWCMPGAMDFGAGLPLVGDKAKAMHDCAGDMLLARQDELNDVARVMHAMAVNLAQVAANYADVEVQVVANFGGVNENNRDILGTLPQVYDIDIKPNRR